jgi:hypothetical protein
VENNMYEIKDKIIKIISDYCHVSVSENTDLQSDEMMFTQDHIKDIINKITEEYPFFEGIWLTDWRNRARYVSGLVGYAEVHSGMPDLPTDEELKKFKREFPHIYKKYRRMEEACTMVWSLGFNCDGYANLDKPSNYDRMVMWFAEMCNCARWNKPQRALDENMRMQGMI